MNKFGREKQFVENASKEGQKGTIKQVFGGLDRTEKLRDRYRAAVPSLCIERAITFTRSYQLTEGEPISLRKAKAFREVCHSIPIIIFDGELIVGTPGGLRRPASICPEMSWKWIEAELDTLETRKQDPYRITAEQKEILKNSIFPYWKGKSLEENYLARLPEDTAMLVVETGILDNDVKWRNGVGEITPDYPDVVFKKGFRGIKRDSERSLGGLEPITPENLEKIIFYKSVSEICEGIIHLGQRYAEKAAQMAKLETNKTRKRELLKISEICDRVPGNPPRSFWEALQMVWFVQIGCILSENALAINLGRFDQYTFPFYEADLMNGQITPEQAQELIECLWIKLSEWIFAISENATYYRAGYMAFQNLTIGGIRRDGSDATNDLSYMCLHATANARTHQPGLSVRIHPNCPVEFLLEVCRLVKIGMGFPAIHNDRLGMAMLVNAGLPPEDARDWSNCGCVVPHYRKVGEWTAAGHLNLAAAIEYATNDGRSRITGRQMGIHTGNPARFRDFDEFKEAYYRQLEYLIKHAVIATVICQQVHSELMPRPFASSLIDGCLEKGKDLTRGGARFAIGSVWTGTGVANVANSLAAIKKIVFEERRVSMAELCRALDKNWEKYERLRQRLLKCAKYGNDDDYVDIFAVELTDFVHRELRKYRDWWGLPFNSAFMGVSNFIPMGAVLGATPDGRIAGSPLTEGCSPHSGTDVTSPTAAMNSVAKINHERHSGGTLLNIKFSPQVLETEKGLRDLAALIRSYFELGGFHVQFNVISTEMLRDAQKYPERYQDLLVRVAGFSTRFVELSKKVQDSIIKRTTYDTV